MSIKGLVLTLGLFVIAFGLIAQDLAIKGVTTKSLFDQMTVEGLKNIRITTDVEMLSKSRNAYNYQEAKALITFSNGDTIQEKLELRARGRYRNRFCELPPLKLKFSNKALQERNLRQLNELKLVIPCQQGKKYTTWMYKEHLVYQMYNLITDVSYRTQVVDVIFEDLETGKVTQSFEAFIIEDKEELAHRFNAEVPDTCVAPPLLNQEMYKCFQVFQFFIGNTDWLLTTCHNVEILKTSELGLFPVPYDFDFSGMVNTTYAIPSDKFPLTKVQDRFFLGNQTSLNPLIPTIDHYRGKKEALIQLVIEFDRLPKGERKKMIKYIESFYKILDDPAKMNNYFVHLLEGSRADHY